MDALVVSGTRGLRLIGTQSWALLLEWWTLRGAKLRISAHDAQVAQSCRKDTVRHVRMGCDLVPAPLVDTIPASPSASGGLNHSGLPLGLQVPSGASGGRKGFFRSDSRCWSGRHWGPPRAEKLTLRVVLKSGSGQPGFGSLFIWYSDLGKDQIAYAFIYFSYRSFPKPRRGKNINGKKNSPNT